MARPQRLRLGARVVLRGTWPVLAALLLAACWSDPSEELDACLAYCDLLRRCNDAPDEDVRLCSEMCELSQEPGSRTAPDEALLACVVQDVTCEGFLSCARSASPGGRLPGDDVEPLPPDGEDGT